MADHFLREIGVPFLSISSPFALTPIAVRS
jgi:hypothetical protein